MTRSGDDRGGAAGRGRPDRPRRGRTVAALGLARQELSRTRDALEALAARLREPAAYREAARGAPLALFFLLFLTDLDRELVRRGLLPVAGPVLFAACMAIAAGWMVARAGRTPLDLARHAEAALRRHWLLAAAFAALVLLSWAQWIRDPGATRRDAISIVVPALMFAGAILLPLLPAVRRGWRTHLAIAFAFYCATVWVDVIWPGTFSIFVERAAGLAVDSNTGAYLTLMLAAPLLRYRGHGRANAVLLYVAGLTVFATLSRGGLALFALLAAWYLGAVLWRRPDRRAFAALAAAAGAVLLVAGAWASVQAFPYFDHPEARLRLELITGQRNWFQTRIRADNTRIRDRFAGRFSELQPLATATPGPTPAPSPAPAPTQAVAQPSAPSSSPAPTPPPTATPPPATPPPATPPPATPTPATPAPATPTPATPTPAGTSALPTPAVAEVAPSPTASAPAAAVTPTPSAPSGPADTTAAAVPESGVPAWERVEGEYVYIDTARVFRLETALRWIADSPITGYGTGYGFRQNISPHNTYLLMWLDLGVAGALLYAALVAAAFLGFWRQRFWPGMVFVAYVASWSMVSQTIFSARPLFVLLGVLLALPLVLPREELEAETLPPREAGGGGRRGDD